MSLKIFSTAWFSFLKQKGQFNRIALLSDVKATGVVGGTSTVGAYETRELNTIVDPTAIVTSLAANRFTLQAGTYFVEAASPNYFNEQARCKIRNITDSSDAILGQSVYLRSTGTGDNAAQVSFNAVAVGYIIITTAKVFELQNRCTVTTASGLGLALNFAGESEVYSTVKITKIELG